jgi:hypothetical protein
MEFGEIILIILFSIVLSVMISTGNYYLYDEVFSVKPCKQKSITCKIWFRGIAVLFIYLPVFNVVGLLVLLYMRAMKSLDIN